MPHEDTSEMDDSLRSLALYNYGHYTSMLVSNGRVRGLTLHLERLTRDSATLFGRPVDTDDVIARVRRVLLDSPPDIVVRITICAADFVMHHPADASATRAVVTVRPVPAAPRGPITLATALFARELPEVKHVGLFGQLWHRRVAQLAGRDDALFVDATGRILEGATWNVGFVRHDGHVVWPNSPALPGVALALVKEKYEEKHPGKSSTTTVKLDDLRNFESAFITNSVSGVRVASLIDTHEFSTNGPILSDLAVCYAETLPEEI